MHDFGIASTPKSWIDHIVRAGKTFKYTATGPVGLIPGKKVVIVVGSGGVYSQGPYKPFDHASTYLDDILTTLGVTDFTILRAEGVALGPEAAAKGDSRWRRGGGNGGGLSARKVWPLPLVVRASARIRSAKPPRPRAVLPPPFRRGRGAEWISACAAMTTARAD
jgi:hypothetical protein